MNPKLKKLLGLHRPKTTFSLIACVVLLKIAFPSYSVSTGSMVPTIPIGSLVFSFRGAFLFDEPQKGDIVIFDPVEGISSYPWVHRVIATSGERIIPPERDGRKDTDSQITVTQNEKEITIPEGYIYQSGDSVLSYHGLAKIDLISAKVFFIYKSP